MNIEDVVEQMQVKLKKAFEAKVCSVTLLPTDLDPKKGNHHTIVPGGSEAKVYITIVSDEFEGLGLLQRQKKVYSLISEELDGPVHAVSSMVTSTPKEWDDALSADS
eukprot:CAMPEP_0181322612 /NCGR_PEP_ID=MMETSP1101-20121128/19322_1 /TAXON_ID=46948 /ORGANISM="Rhodomonas abbreviata, Strain Caron Lab Isolate" /LENGTH=106 /DNA_ID=CAMNT_0023430539 /DNA_START=280 /DNA_END=600 /DNA_ORIENTATION=+